MTDETSTSIGADKPPIWYWVVSIIGLLWFLMDLSAFFMRVLMSEEGIQSIPEGHQHPYLGMPLWVDIVFAFEVFGGTLGCIGLLIRRNWALPLLILSLLGVISQTFYIYFLSDAISSMGAPAVIMPLLAIAITVCMILLARSAKSRHWLRQ